MEENIKKLEIRLINDVVITSQKDEATDAKIDELRRKLDMLMERLASAREKILGTPLGNLQVGGSGILTGAQSSVMED
ncbi:hypothetical protein HAX54_007353 [Datura stramonium]|uniref:Uncharacterized protein n=1 Tax=Datura stramonium TaxID=4076 RepID=A0ABS8TBN1_DATST|nr:hypothetical protein [Datura stramonium]